MGQDRQNVHDKENARISRGQKCQQNAHESRTIVHVFGQRRSGFGGFFDVSLLTFEFFHQFLDRLFLRAILGVFQ